MSACSHLVFVSILWSNGIRNAAVLPVQVCDCHIIFFPLSAISITCFWISVASRYFISVKALIIQGFKLNSVNNIIVFD
ncbi:MAG: hypothetical protein WCG25_07055 [bacterium]